MLLEIARAYSPALKNVVKRLMRIIGQNDVNSRKTTSTRLERNNMTAQEFIENIGTVYYKLNYESFCQVCDFVPSDYSEEKFKQFQEMCKSLEKFDTDLLVKLASSK